MRLQKALTDFGADESFAKAALKVKEHYGVDVAISTTRLDVEKNARKIQATEKSNRFSVNLRPSECIIGQLDGSMIPIVSQTEPAKTGDKRKNKQYEWKEIRVAVGNPKGSDTSIYAAIMGSTDEAGECLARVVKQAGKRKKTKIHCLGDGALWIAEQVEQQFGPQATFTLDFYHASEHLADAASCCNKDSSKEWLREQQDLLKKGEVNQVMNSLHLHQENCLLKEAKGTCSAESCYNYLSKRLHQLNYKDALASETSYWIRRSGRVLIDL